MSREREWLASTLSPVEPDPTRPKSEPADKLSTPILPSAPRPLEVSRCEAVRRNVSTVMTGFESLLLVLLVAAALSGVGPRGGAPSPAFLGLGGGAPAFPPGAPP